MSYTPKSKGYNLFESNPLTPSMEKNLLIKEKKIKYQCKCHWTPEKETLYNDLH